MDFIALQATSLNDPRVTHPPPNSNRIKCLASADRTLHSRALDTHSTITLLLSRVPHIHIGQLGIFRSALRLPHSPSTYRLSSCLALTDPSPFQSIYVSHTTTEPNATLVSGTTSSDLVFLHFAYTELRSVSTDTSPSSSTRRTALFSDQKYNPSLWSTLARASLVRFGEDYQTLLRRGASAPPRPPSTTTSTTATASKLLNPPATPILRQPIYKPPQQSPLTRILNTFASDSELSKAAEELTEEVGSATKDVHVPELFRSVVATAASVVPVPSSVTPASAAGQAGPSVDPRAIVRRAIRACGDGVVQCVPPQIRVLGRELYDWATRERVHKRVEKILAHRELDALIIECKFWFQLYARDRQSDTRLPPRPN